jgi:hypothetical protein
MFTVEMLDERVSHPRSLLPKGLLKVLTKRRGSAELSEIITAPPQTRQRRIHPSTRISGPSNPACRPSEQTVHSPPPHITYSTPNPCRPLKKVSHALMSHILTTPQYCNPTMRAGMELAGFLNEPAWSVSLCVWKSPLVTKQARWWRQSESWFLFV